MSEVFWTASTPAVWRRGLPAVGDSALARWMGIDAPGSPSGALEPYALRRVPEGATLVAEGAPARAIYIVQAGHFKVVRTAEDGYEQVLDFIGRMDAIGLEAIAAGVHGNSAVALQDSTAYAVPLPELESLRRRNPVFAARLQTTMSRQLARAGDLAWMLAAVGADRRTARFVIVMSRRMAEEGQSRLRLRLHMPRRDIAAAIGLAHESISRSLTALAAGGLLRVHNRDIEILDLERLQAFARNTRGPAEKPEHLPCIGDRRRTPTLPWAASA